MPENITNLQRKKDSERTKIIKATSKYNCSTTLTATPAHRRAHKWYSHNIWKTTDQTIATFQFFDACIYEVQQSSLTGTHRFRQLQLQFHNVNLNSSNSDAVKHICCSMSMQPWDNASKLIIFTMTITLILGVSSTLFTYLLQFIILNMTMITNKTTVSYHDHHHCHSVVINKLIY